MFAGKVRIMQGTTLVGCNLACKFRVEVTDSEKHSSLFRDGIIFTARAFYNTVPAGGLQILDQPEKNLLRTNALAYFGEAPLTKKKGLSNL